MPLPRVLCRGWRNSMGSLFPCAAPVLQPGEPGGRLIHDAQCRFCGALQRKGDEERYARECRRTAARAAKGYGAPAEGVDVFDGFKEG